MFSIIVPLYNKENSVSGTIKSALNAFRNYDFEIIIVNDGSTDKSLSIAENLAKKESRIVIISQENGGVSKARNKGITEARYQYLVFLDADDLVTEHIANEYYSLIQNFDDNTGLFCVGYEVVSEDKSIRFDCRKALGSNSWFGIIDNPLEIMSKYKGSSFIHTSAVCVNKDIQSKLGIFFPEGVTHTEDTSFFYDFIMHSTVAYSSRICTKYKLDSENRSNTSKPLGKRYIITKLESEINKGKVKKKWIKNVKSFIGKNYVHLCYNCLEFKNKERFKDNIKQGLRYFPYMSPYYRAVFLVFLLLQYSLASKLIKR